ncbi:hypothetical protein PspLS_05726 [Pyricularia sp. CBS 133598]|nr:hypothetical protein PspLS_05726 [Pyricularia sp. CBS 133598]
MASVSMALSGNGGPCKNDGDCERCVNGVPLICLHSKHLWATTHPPEENLHTTLLTLRTYR